MGAKYGNIIGCGFFCNKTCFSYRLPPSISVITAKLIAIERDMLNISHHHNISFIIYTVSNCSVDAIKSFKKHPFSLAILDFYNQLTRCSYKILFCWVPGRMCIPGKEKADKAAKYVLNPLHHTFSNFKILINFFILYYFILC